MTELQVIKDDLATRRAEHIINMIIVETHLGISTDKIVDKYIWQMKGTLNGNSAKDSCMVSFWRQPRQGGIRESETNQDEDEIPHTDLLRDPDYDADGQRDIEKDNEE